MPTFSMAVRPRGTFYSGIDIHEGKLLPIQDILIVEEYPVVIEDED